MFPWGPIQVVPRLSGVFMGCCKSFHAACASATASSFVLAVEFLMGGEGVAGFMRVLERSDKGLIRLLWALQWRYTGFTGLDTSGTI